MNGDEMVVYRLNRLEFRVDDHDKSKADLKDVEALAEEMRSLRRAFNTLAASIAISAFVFALGAFQFAG